MEYINSILSYFSAIADTNMVVALWAMTVVSFIGYRIPKIWQFITSRFTYTLTLDPLLDGFQKREFIIAYMKYIADKKLPKITNRNFSLTVDESNVNSSHWGVYQGQLYRCVISTHENQSTGVKTTHYVAMTFTFFGFHSRGVEHLTKFLKSTIKSNTEYAFVKMSDTLWDELAYFDTTDKTGQRSFDSLIMNPETKQTIIDKLDWFKNNKAWYDRYHRSYKLGILICGQPGNGKSTLSQVIAHYLQSRLIYVDPLTSPLARLINMQNRSVMVFDDFNPNDLENNNRVNDNNNTGMSRSDILKLLDGTLLPQNTVFIFTTNRIEQFDAELIRPGRIDLVIELNNLDSDLIHAYIEYMFPNYVRRDITFTPQSGAFLEHKFDLYNHDVELFINSIPKLEDLN